MSRRRSSILWGLALLTVAALASADPPPPVVAPYGTLIPVPGLSGRFVLSGDRPSDVTIDAFVELAGGAEAPIAIIVPSADATRGWWTDRAPIAASVHVVASRADAEAAALRDRIGAVRGVWLHGPTMPRLGPMIDGTALHAALEALVARGGVLGAVGLDASSLGDQVIRRADGRLARRSRSCAPPVPPFRPTTANRAATAKARRDLPPPKKNRAGQASGPSGLINLTTSEVVSEERKSRPSP